MPSSLIRLARPADWVKNVFILLPVPFALTAAAREQAVSFREVAGSFLHEMLGPFLWGLAGFCLINSAVYTLNDLLDAEADRLHPRKRHRPIASGAVPPRAAMIQIVVLALCGMAMALLVGPPAMKSVIALMLVYVSVNVFYSLWGKHVALLDVFLLCCGFVIRVLLGCALINVVASAWLLLCTSSLALFLGFVKRRADLTTGLDTNHRPSLRGYSLAFLDQAITIAAGVAILAYALYCIESDILIPGREMASMPFVAYAILNYLRLANTENLGASPVEVAWRSRSTQLCALGWMAALTWSLRLA